MYLLFSFLLVILLNAFIYLKGSEWKDKAERLELELQQCYIAQSRLSEQLATEVAEGRVSNSLYQEKSIAVANLEKQVAQLRLASYAFRH